MGFDDSCLVLELGIGPDRRNRYREASSVEKRAQEQGSGGSWASSRISDEDDRGSCGRKKLRLSKNQASLLEESFGRHSSLTPMLKQELARELILTPRQVEVWYQNRRARAKLKQTEANCELLRRLCTSLSEENQRLRKELEEVKAVKSVTPPLCMRIPAAAIAICPSCQRIGGATVITQSSAATAAKSSFTHTPSAAC